MSSDHPLHMVKAIELKGANGRIRAVVFQLDLHTRLHSIQGSSSGETWASASTENKEKVHGSSEKPLLFPSRDNELLLFVLGFVLLLDDTSVATLVSSRRSTNPNTNSNSSLSRDGNNKGFSLLPCTFSLFSVLALAQVSPLLEP